MFAERLENGRRFEANVCGICTTAPTSYTPYSEALEDVMESQPKHLPSFALRLTVAVKEQLPGAVQKYLHFYTAVGSSLDHFHGLDSFFRIGKLTVTIDVTVNSQKTEGKADLVLHPEDWDNLSEVAVRIARLFKERACKKVSVH